MHDSDPIDGAPLPSPADSRWHKVVGPKGTSPLRVVFLSDKVRGYWTHWDKMALPCHRTPDCPGCKAGLGQRWTGYAAVYSLTHKAEVVLMLSEGAARQLVPTVQQHGSLRGFNVELCRRLPKPNAPVHVTVGKREQMERCPTAFSVMDSLNRLWGINEAKMRDGGPRPHDGDDDAAPGVVIMPYRPRTPDVGAIPY